MLTASTSGISAALAFDIQNVRAKMYALLCALIAMLLLGCGGSSQKIVQKKAPSSLPDSLQIEVLRVEHAQLPEIKVLLSIKDRECLPILGLAPPFARDQNWREYWQFLAATHEKFGADSIRDFTVLEGNSSDALKREHELSTIARLCRTIEQIRKGLFDASSLARRAVVEAKRQYEAKHPQSEANKKARHVVLVLDRSGSMNGAPIEEAKAAMMEYVTFVDANFAFIVFDNSPQLIAPFFTPVSELVQKIEAISSGGGTQLYDALYEAINLLKSVDGEKQIIALTDGQTSGDQYSLEQIINFANSGEISVEAKTPQNTKLFSIGLGYRSEGLVALAEKTGGQYYDAPSPDALLDVFSQIAGFQLQKTHGKVDHVTKRYLRACEDSLKTLLSNFSYSFSYKTQFPRADGMSRTFSVRVHKNVVRGRFTTETSATEMALNGTVVSEQTRERVPFARVHIRPQGADTVYTAVADSAGYFGITLPRIYESYTVFIEADRSYFIEVREEELAAARGYYQQRDFTLKKLEKDVTVVIRTIHFENNEYIFEPISLPDLMILGGYFANRKHLKIEISGHTDSYGSDSYNQWLSERRAEQVEEFFASLGVPQQNMIVRGYGESKPIPDADRYAQRRVEIKVLEIMPEDKSGVSLKN